MSKGDRIFEIESDKALMEVKAEGDGILHILVPEGEELIAVDTPVALLLEEGEMRQIPLEIKIIWKAFRDAGMSVDREMHDEIIKEMVDRLGIFMASELAKNLPAKDLDTLIKMNEQNAPKADSERFILDHVPNAREVVSNAYIKISEQFLGNRA